MRPSKTRSTRDRKHEGAVHPVVLELVDYFFLPPRARSSNRCCLTTYFTGFVAYNSRSEVWEWALRRAASSTHHVLVREIGVSMNFPFFCITYIRLIRMGYSTSIVMVLP